MRMVVDFNRCERIRCSIVIVMECLEIASAVISQIPLLDSIVSYYLPYRMSTEASFA